MHGSFRYGGEDIRVGEDIWVAVLGPGARLCGVSFMREVGVSTGGAAPALCSPLGGWGAKWRAVF